MELELFVATANLGKFEAINPTYVTIGKKTS